MVQYNSFEIGKSAGGYSIGAYKFGVGAKKIVFVGGIHGGAETSTILLITKTIRCFGRQKEKIPNGITVFFIPLLNPDGYFSLRNMISRGINPYGIRESLEIRCNSRMVDLNRNWDFDWKPKTGQAFGDSSINDGGAYPFSEPETKALGDFLRLHRVKLVFFYHSMLFNSKIVIPGREGRFISGPPSQALISAMPSYTLKPRLGDYTGLAIDYLDREGIPAVDIEIPSSAIDYRTNLRGMAAAIKWANSAVGRE
jgi:hypothetical protein